MALSPAQLVVLNTFIQATPEMAAQPNNSDGAFAIAQALSQVASPPYTVWKSTVSQDEITQNGFVWTEVDNLTVGKARIWEWLFRNAASTFNPSKANVRAGIVECWSGTAGKLAVQAAVFVHCKRLATISEKLFATGLGTDVSPSTMAVEGAISLQDVQAARG